MEKIVTITSQGQLTIPQVIRKFFNLVNSTKAVVKVKGNAIIVEPKGNFWSLSGSLKSSVRLTDKELQKARSSFSEKWAQKI